MYSCPTLGDDGVEVELSVQYFHSRKSAYDDLPTSRHACDVQPLVYLIIIVVQIQARGMQEEAVGFFRVAYPGSQNGVDKR